MSSFYLKSGNTFRVSSKESLDLHETLPVGNYVIKFSPDIGFFLDQIDDFKMPAKMYGDIFKNTSRILNTFLCRDGGTGILLSGEKGSGKSLLAKNISVEAGKQSIPTLIINTPFNGDGFNSFMQSIEQPCIVLLDEYEKVYDKDEQQAMLTLLDGVYPSKKLFVLTVNDKWRVDQHMRNRPGRIYYILDYSGLDENFIREYCQDNLKNTSEIDRIVHVTHTFDMFNFDMLKALIEEMNRYNESVVDAIKFLNVKAEFAGAVEYEIDLLVSGVAIPKDALHTRGFKGNPLAVDFSVEFTCGKDSDGDDVWGSADFTPSDLKSIDQGGQKYVFLKEKMTAVLTRTYKTSYNYLDYM